MPLPRMLAYDVKYGTMRDTMLTSSGKYWKLKKVHEQLRKIFVSLSVQSHERNTMSPIVHYFQAYPSPMWLSIIYICSSEYVMYSLTLLLFDFDLRIQSIK